jgi:hypothetical protein
MEEFLARQNVLHYRQMLESAKDDVQRRTLLQLLAEEEAKLATQQKPKPND